METTWEWSDIPLVMMIQVVCGVHLIGWLTLSHLKKFFSSFLSPLFFSSNRTQHDLGLHVKYTRFLRYSLCGGYQSIRPAEKTFFIHFLYQSYSDWMFWSRERQHWTTSFVEERAFAVWSWSCWCDFIEIYLILFLRNFKVFCSLNTIWFCLLTVFCICGAIFVIPICECELW